MLLSRAKPWVLAVSIIGFALLMYLFGQGVHYWHASGSNAELAANIQRLEAGTGPELPVPVEESAALETEKSRLESLRNLFEHPETDGLLAIISGAAAEAGLQMVSMKAEDATSNDRGSLRYQVRSISIVVDGPQPAVRSFLSLVHQQVPVTAASEIRTVNIDTDPSTQLQLLFYLSPTPIPEDEEEGNG